MRIDFSIVIVDADDKPLEQENATKDKVTLRWVVRQALLGQFSDETNLSEGEKERRFELWMDIRTGREEFVADEIVLMKKLVNKMFGTLVYGQVARIIDPKPTK